MLAFFGQWLNVVDMIPASDHLATNSTLPSLGISYAFYRPSWKRTPTPSLSAMTKFADLVWVRLSICLDRSTLSSICCLAFLGGFRATLPQFICRPLGVNKEANRSQISGSLKSMCQSARSGQMIRGNALVGAIKPLSGLYLRRSGVKCLAASEAFPAFFLFFVSAPCGITTWSASLMEKNFRWWQPHRPTALPTLCCRPPGCGLKATFEPICHDEVYTTVVILERAVAAWLAFLSRCQGRL